VQARNTFAKAFIKRKQETEKVASRGLLSLDPGALMGDPFFSLKLHTYFRLTAFLLIV